MPSEINNGAWRSRIAEACLDFGSHLLQVRSSSVTLDDAQSAIKILFGWFASQDALKEANVGIAIHCIDFGKQLLETRKTVTLQEAIETIQGLFSDLSK